MIKNLSWSEFLEFIFYTIIAYYIIVAVIYHKNELLSFLKGRQKEEDFYPAAGEGFELVTEAPFIPDNDVDKDELATVQIELIRQIDSLTERGLAKKFDKEKFLHAFEILLETYLILLHTPYLNLINQYIIYRCKTYCSIHLNAEEVDSLWKRKVDGAI